MNAGKRDRVLITRGSGFLGQHLVARLAAQGRTVAATSTRETSALEWGKEVQWVRWDARRQTAPDVAWDTVDTVVHLAKPREAIRGNDVQAANYTLSAAATFELLRLSARHGVRRFLFASTGYVLGRCDRPAEEMDRRYAPLEAYGAYKACGELITDAFARELTTATVRIFFPYGSGGGRYFVQRLVHAVREGEEIHIDGAEGVRLNPVWIDDFVDGVIRTMDSDAVGTFHLAGPQTVTLRELTEWIGELVGRRPALRHVAGGEGACHVGDIRRAAAVLGYVPTMDVRAGLRKLLSCAAEAAA